jgi:hypothetical protein
MLLIIDLTEVEHLALHHPIATTVPIFHDAPVAVLFTVLEALGRT